MGRSFTNATLRKVPSSPITNLPIRIGVLEVPKNMRMEELLT